MCYLPDVIKEATVLYKLSVIAIWAVTDLQLASGRDCSSDVEDVVTLD